MDTYSSGPLPAKAALYPAIEPLFTFFKNSFFALLLASLTVPFPPFFFLPLLTMSEYASTDILVWFSLLYLSTSSKNAAWFCSNSLKSEDLAPAHFL